jgi:hypothetical protein
LAVTHPIELYHVCADIRLFFCDQGSGDGSWGMVQCLVQSNDRVCGFLRLYTMGLNRLCSADHKIRRHISGQLLF